MNTVNARDLHSFLESKQEFLHWMKNRVKKYNFTEGTDFIAIDNSITSPPSIDYNCFLGGNETVLPLDLQTIIIPEREVCLSLDHQKLLRIEIYRLVKND